MANSADRPDAPPAGGRDAPWVRQRIEHLVHGAKGYALEMMHALCAGGDELLAAAQLPDVNAVQRVRQPEALRMTPLELLSLGIDEGELTGPPIAAKPRTRPRVFSA